MKIIIQSPGFKVNAALGHYIERQVGRLMASHPEIAASRVNLRIDPSGKPDNKICEVQLEVPGNDLFASKQSDRFEEAVARTIEALRSQITRRKPDHHGEAVA